MSNGSGMMQSVMQILQGNGMNGEQAVRIICNKQGVDFDSFMQMVRTEYNK